MAVRNKFNFDRIAKNLKQNTAIMKSLAAAAKKYFNASFRAQAWDGKPWAQVQRRIPGTQAYLYPSRPKSSAKTRPILVGKGTLRKAVANSLKLVTASRALFVVSDVDYAKVHNEGLPFRSSTMPKRKFMGDSKTLRTQQKELIKEKMKAIWRA